MSAVHPGAELGPEAACVRAIEDIGQQIYGDSGRKYIWQALQASDGSELEATVLGEKEGRVLLTLAQEKHLEMTQGCI